MQVLFEFPHPMANDRSKGNLAVNVGEDLLERVNAVASALHKSQAQFVRDVLEEGTKAHQKEVAEIVKLKRKIADRAKRE
jgi:hypothetical protein